MQYMIMTGPLNLRLVAPDKWYAFKDLVARNPAISEKYPDLNFLDSLFIPMNKDLGRFIERLYNNQADEHINLTATSNRLSYIDNSPKFDTRFDRSFRKSTL